MEFLLPKELGDITPEIKEIIKSEIAKDQAFRKLAIRYGKIEDDTSIPQGKKARMLADLDRQIDIRVKDFSKWWMKKYGQAKLSTKEVLAILEDEDKEKFVRRIDTMLFLADFMEDCLVETNYIIKEYLYDATYNPLEDMFAIVKKVRNFIRPVFDEEGEGYIELFDEHSADIKTTIINKVNAFINADERRRKQEEMDKRQLTFNFKEYEDDDKNN